MIPVVNRAACLTGFAALLIIPAAALAQSGKSALSAADSKFVTEAAQGGLPK